ncbi:MAG: CHRD domain-containing protein [Bacteroidales bacterium]|nr:CHRD domain-containing protein [Bacteroidales bacterium]
MKTLKKQHLDPVVLGGKFFLKFMIIAGLFLTAVSCDDDDDDDEPNDVFTATLSGANENPPNESNATGMAELTYNKDTKIFYIEVEYTGVEATGAHIHLGATGVNGGVVFGFNPPTSPIIYTSEPLTAEQESDLYNELYYVNIHSETYPAGEIRGQLTME